MARLSDLNMIELVLGGSILLVALGIVFPPDIFLFKQGTNFSVQIMFLFLLMGMGCLVLQRERLMFVCLGASAILALNLKTFSDQTLSFPSVNANPSLSVAHIDLSLSEDKETTLHAIRTHDVDVLSFQEYSPYWDKVLPEALITQYPFRLLDSKLPPYGKAIFSKFPLCIEKKVVIQDFDDMEVLHVQLLLDEGATAHIVSTHSFPLFNDEAYTEIHKYFEKVGQYVKGLEGPVITLGDFSLPPWSEEIKYFKEVGRLMDSRRDLAQQISPDRMFLFNIPIEHIFYSYEIECTAFSVINEQTSPLGITGSYQLKRFQAFNAIDVD